MEATFPILKTITQAPRLDLRWIAAGGCSLLIHSAVFAVGIGWFAWGLAPLDHVTFAGRQQAITIQAQWSTAAVQSPPPVAQPDAAIPVVITPHQARIEDHRFVEVEVAEIPLPQPTEPLIAEKSEMQTTEQPPLTETVPPVPRRPAATSPAVNQTAAMPTQLGTEKSEPPVFANNQPPMYPELARQRRWQGTVLLRLKIAVDGQVSEVTVANSSGYDLLDAAAVTAVRHWQAQPARRGGKPVATEELLPVRFRLD